MSDGAGKNDKANFDTSPRVIARHFTGERTLHNHSLELAQRCYNARRRLGRGWVTPGQTASRADRGSEWNIAFRSNTASQVRRTILSFTFHRKSSRTFRRMFRERCCRNSSPTLSGSARRKLVEFGICAFFRIGPTNRKRPEAIECGRALCVQRSLASNGSPIFLKFGLALPICQLRRDESPKSAADA
jgi:hypothetical protein